MVDSVIHEKIGALTAKVEAAHMRTDKLETLLREDLSEIKKDLKALYAAHNYGKGRTAALVFLIGIFGGVMQYAVALITKHN